MRIVRPIDKQIRRYKRAKAVAEKYGCEDMVRVADKALRDAKREKRQRIQAVRNHSRVVYI